MKKPSPGRDGIFAIRIITWSLIPAADFSFFVARFVVSNVILQIAFYVDRIRSISPLSDPSNLGPYCATTRIDA